MGKTRDLLSATLKKTLICKSNERKKKKSRNSGKCWGKQRSLHSASNAANAVVVPASNPPTVELASTAAEDERNKHQHSAADVEEMAAGARNFLGMDQEEASVKIQRAYRGYLARQALRTMKALVRLKSAVDRQCTRRQSATALKYAQTRAHLQSEVPATRVKTFENDSGVERQIQQKQVKNLDKRKASAEDGFCVYSKNKTILDPNDPRWRWSFSKQWMAADKSQTNRSPIDEEVKSGHATVKSSAQGDTKLQSPKLRKQTQVPYWQPPSTPNLGRLKQPSPRFSVNSKNDESKSITSIHSERCRRHHSFGGSSVGDDTSLASCPAYTRGYMASTVASRAKSRPPSLLGRTPVKATGGLARKRLSFSGAPAPAASFPGHSVSPKMGVIPTKDGVQTHNGINN